MLEHTHTHTQKQLIYIRFFFVALVIMNTQRQQ